MIVIVVSVASVTLKEATPTTPPKTAVTVTVPGASPSAQPYDPDMMLMVTREGFDDVHSTEFVMSCLEPSVRVPVAVKAIDVFSAKLKPALLVVEMAMAVNPSTVTLAVPSTPPREQVMVTGLADMDSPVTIFPFTLATLVSEDAQVATVVIG